jgi:hypothetical protein
MAVRNPRPKKPMTNDVDLAIAALDGNPNPLDMDLRYIDPAPTSLDIDFDQQDERCRKPHRRPRGVCRCGRLLPRS